MAKPRLYWCPQTRAIRALWLLEELGIPYELVKIDVRAGEQSDPAFRAISPLGKTPVQRDTLYRTVRAWDGHGPEIPAN